VFCGGWRASSEAVALPAVPQADLRRKVSCLDETVYAGLGCSRVYKFLTLSLTRSRTGVSVDVGKPLVQCSRSYLVILQASRMGSDKRWSGLCSARVLC
jgi:hypothetical protein